MDGVTPIVKLNSGCDYHRIILPMQDLGIDNSKFTGKSLHEVVEQSKIIWFNRTPGGLTRKSLEFLKDKYGFKLVLDLDDYWVLHPKHNLNQIWKISDMENEIPAWIKMADAVIVTTNLLADKVRPLNPFVHVIPNALPYGKAQFLNARIESEYMRFLYAGGGSHLHDLKVLTMPFQKCNNNPAFKNAQFIMCGFHAIKEHPESEIEWTKMEHTFNLSGRLKNYIRRTTLPLDSYMRHYDHCDVAVIPLEDNRFNIYKSNLKILEAASNDSAVIVSDMEPYSSFPDRDLIMFGTNTRTWYEHLEYCIKNPNFVRERGKALGEFTRSVYELSKVNEYRRQLFELLMKS